MEIIKKKRFLFALAFTILLMSFLLSQVDLGELVDFLLSISPEWIAIALFFYLLGNVFRALRFRTLLDGRIGTDSMFSVVCVHYLFNNLLPARTGELSYIYLLKKVRDIPSGTGIATLMMARFLDFLVIATLFLLAVTFVGELPETVSNAFAGIVVFLAFSIFFILSLIYKGTKAVNFIGSMAKSTGTYRFGAVRFFLKKAEETTAGVRGISRKNVIRSFIASVIIWLCLFSTAYSVVRGMHIGLSPEKTVIAATFPVFTAILPIQSVGGFGTSEGAWALAMVSMGASKEVAISSGFGVHLASFMFSMAFGAYGIFRLRARLFSK